ncbi:QRFP-like peptide receptor [Glandiceps talaboti]
MADVDDFSSLFWNGSIDDLLAALNLTSIEEFLEKYDYEHILSPVVHQLSSSARTVLTIFYVLIFVVGLLGNGLVIVVVAANKSMQTVTNVFIVSLAISDIMIAVLSVPFTLVEASTAEWVMGLFMCKLVNFITVLSLVSSVLTLSCIAIDRYYAICQPLKTRIIHTTARAVKLLIFVWVAAVIIASPLLFVHQLRIMSGVVTDDTYVLCTESWQYQEQKITYTVFLVAITYVVPLSLMIVLYLRIYHQLWVKNNVGPTNLGQQNVLTTIKYKKKATKMLILVVVLFFVCWTPYQVVTVRREFPPFKDNETNRLVLALITLVALSNCCLNPIVYTFLNVNFKKSFVATLKCKKVKITPTPNNNTQQIPLSGSNI